MPVDEENKKATHALRDLEVFQIDIVDAPATGERFVQVRSAEDGGEIMPRRTSMRASTAKEMSDDKEVATDNGPNFININVERGGTVNLHTKDSSNDTEDVERQVPPEDATPEKKREAQKKRAAKYGIEALEGKGERLTYPKGKATRESLYGDPVNLGFPFASDSNKLDVKLANNARTRFKQFADRYEKQKSKKVVHNRIVAAQLKAGASPGFDPDDPLDKLLSADLKKKLQKPVERTVDDNSNERLESEDMGKLEEKVDRLAAAFERMAELPLFKNILNPEAADPEKDKKEDSEELDAAQTDDQESSTAEAPAEAPDAATEQSSAEVPTEQSPEAPAASEATSEPATAPVEAPAPAASESSVDGMATAVERLGNMVEKLGEQVEKIGKSTEKLTGRVDSVERSIKSGGNAAGQDETESVDRGKKPGMWSNILG